MILFLGKIEGHQEKLFIEISDCSGELYKIHCAISHTASPIRSSLTKKNEAKKNFFEMEKGREKNISVFLVEYFKF